MSPTPPSTPGGSTTARAIVRGAGLILVITVIARIAGFVRYLVFGASVGAGDVGTAYSTANLLPNVLFEVVAGGALAAVVVPLIAGLVPERDPHPSAGDDEALVDPDPGVASSDDTRPTIVHTEVPVGRRARSERADHIISGLLTWTLAVTTLMALLVIALAEPLAQLLLAVEDDAASGAPLGAALLRIFALQLPLYGISVVLGAYLQARKRFLWPAMMPLISSLVVMVSYRIYAHLVPPVATIGTIGDGAVAWLGWGTTGAVAAMTLPVLIMSFRAGLRVRPRLTMPPGVGRRALALGGAGLGAVGAQQLVLALIMVLAVRAGGTGTLPVFQYAQALYLLPFAVLVVPLITAMFPHLSELRLVGDATGFARLSSVSVRTVIVVSVVGAATLLAGGPALEQFFRLVDRAGAAGVGSTTAALALGLPGFAVTTQCTRVLSAALRARDALIVGSVGWVIAAVLLLITILPSPTRAAAEAATGFGLAIAIGMAVSALVGFSRISDILEPGGDLPRLRRTVILAPMALVAGGVPGLLLARWMVRADSAEVATVLSGLAAGLVAALLAAAVIVAADPQLPRQIIGRVRRPAPAPTPPEQAEPEPGPPEPETPEPGPAAEARPPAEDEQ